MEILIIIIACAISGFMAGMTSFGYAIIASVLLPFILPVKDVTIVILISAIGTYFIVFKDVFLKAKVKLDWKMFLIPMLFSTIGRFFGTNLYQLLDEKELFIILCIFMFVLNIYFLVIAKKIKIKPTKINGGIAGIVSGFFGGLNNVSGPPIVVYYNSVEHDRIKRTAYQQLVFAYGALYSILFHIINGNISKHLLNISLLGFVGALIGTYIGYALYVKFNNAILTKIVKMFVLIGSIILILKAYIELL